MASSNRIISIRTSAEKKIAQVKELLETRDIDYCYSNFFRGIRIFFTALFHIKYQFTYEELFSEIYSKRFSLKLKKKVLDFLEQCASREYQISTHSKEDLLNLLESFDQIVILLTEAAQGGPQQNALLTRAKPHKRILKEPFFYRLQKTFIKKKDPLNSLHNLLLEAKAALAGKNTTKLLTLYPKIKSFYALLSENEKREIYPEIISIYGQITK